MDQSIELPSRGDNLQSLDTPSPVAGQPAFVDFSELNYFYHSVITVLSSAVGGGDIYKEGPSSDICPEKIKNNIYLISTSQTAYNRYTTHL